MAMLIARSILSFAATYTATQCSAALPTTATITAPMKNSLRPIDSAVCAIEPTRISDISPTARPAIASTMTERLTLHGSCPSPLFSSGGLNRSRWLMSENQSPPQPADQHRAAHHQQDVAQHRADDRRLDDLVQALPQGEERDQQLRQVAER